MSKNFKQNDNLFLYESAGSPSNKYLDKITDAHITGLRNMKKPSQPILQMGNAIMIIMGLQQ